MANRIYDLKVLKALDLQCHQKPLDILVPIYRLPPPINYVKVNTDGSVTTDSATCGGVIRDFNGHFMGGFSCSLPLMSVYLAELIGVIHAIHFLINRGYSHVCMELDSYIAVLTLKEEISPPWQIRNIWRDALSKLKNINYTITHTYREGNTAADEMAMLAHNFRGLIWWDHIP